MNAWRALLVAEFRRAAGFLPWLIGLHGLTLGARTRWVWDISPQSLALIEWASWTLAGLVMGISLWQDAPLRRDRFLATRPHRLATLVTAKALALWAIAVLPFVAVEFAALRFNGMAGEIVGLGTLQLAMWLTALLAAAFPLLWWWSTRRMAVAGLLMGVAGWVLATLALSRLPGNRNIYSGTPWTVPISPLSVLGTVGLFALGGCLLLPLLQRRGGVIRGLAFSALVGLSLWGGLVISFRQAPADEIMPASLVDLSVQCVKYQSGDFDMLSITVPRDPLPGTIVRRLTLANLVVDGRDITHWPSGGTHVNPPRGTHTAESWSQRWIIQDHLGKSLAWEGGYSDDVEQAAGGVLPDGHSPDRRLTLAADVLETRYLWEVVADLPAKEGATAMHADTQWRIVNLSKDSAKGATALVTFMNRRYLSLEATSARLWLGNQFERRAYADCNDVLVVVDLTRGVVIRIAKTTDESELTAGNPWPFATSLRHQRQMYTVWPDDAPVDWDHEIRLLVMRPKVVRRILHPWRPQDEIHLQIPPAEAVPQWRSSKPGPNLPVGEWLAAHPVPSAEASPAAATDWLNELGDYLAGGRNHRARSDAGLKRAVATLVNAHPVVGLEAYHRARRWFRYEGKLIESAFEDFLTSDEVVRRPNWHTDPLVVGLAVSKGWVPVIAEAVTRKARSGGITDVSAALTGAPEQIGLSEAEWLDYFRLRPLGATYQALVDKVVPRKVLDREVERMLGPLSAGTRDHDSLPLVDLALGSGSREGPEWLGDALSPGRLHPGYTALFMANFVIPDLPVVHGQSQEESFREWFLAQDVSRFVYDPQTRKYHLP